MGAQPWIGDKEPLRRRPVEVAPATSLASEEQPSHSHVWGNIEKSYVEVFGGHGAPQETSAEELPQVKREVSTVPVRDRQEAKGTSRKRSETL